MPHLEEQPDWSAFVDRAVDELLDEMATSDRRRANRELRSPVESPEFREMLVEYSASLLEAAAAGTGAVVCNDGSTTVECAFVLRPDGAPYYRCRHSPPDCYDADGNGIACP